MSTTPAGKERCGREVASAARFGFRDFLAAVEGLFLPDRPAVPGAPKLNTSPYPRSRYKAHPHLRPPTPPRPRLPRLPKVGL